MKNFLITGVSSGIGRALTKKLVKEGNMVWGVARREELLKDLKKELNNSSKFFYSEMDISKNESWEKLLAQMEKAKFIPRTIIFNAAINKNDLIFGLETNSTREIFEINLFGALEGIRVLLKSIKPRAEFIAISSSSALKGSKVEGIGYPASKAALSIAFESLHQKFKGKYSFKTIYFGPINSGMGPFKKNSLFLLSEEQAINKILQVVKGKKAVYYYPKILFFLLKTIKLLPSVIYYSILDLIENFHLKNQKLESQK